MKNSALSSRATLVARSRRHFAAFATTGLVLTGALAACAAHDEPSESSTSTSDDSGEGASNSSSSSTSDSPSDSGISSPSNTSSPSDGASNAS